MSTLYRYFKLISKSLPDPEGPLSETLPSATIKAANEAVLAASKQPPNKQLSKRGHYVKLTGVQQAQIARYALFHGNQAAIRRYNEEYSTEIKESSVSTWKSKYVNELDRKRKAGDFEASGEVVIDTLPLKKRGRPLLLGSELDDQVKCYIKDARAAGTPIDTTVVMASGEAIVRKTDKNLLKDSGGPIDITKTWAKSLLSRLGFVKRKANSTAKVAPSYYQQLKEQYLLDIEVVVEMEDIPADLIMNWDHTGINIVPGCPWTMEEKGAKRVDCVELDDKRQITVVICATVHSLLDSNHVYVVRVPPNCTGHLQPMDLAVNKSVKDFLRKKFQVWYSEQVGKT